MLHKVDTDGLDVPKEYREFSNQRYFLLNFVSINNFIGSLFYIAGLLNKYRTIIPKRYVRHMVGG